MCIFCTFFAIFSILDFSPIFQPILAPKMPKNGHFSHFVYSYKQKVLKMCIFKHFCLYLYTKCQKSPFLAFFAAIIGWKFSKKSRIQKIAKNALFYRFLAIFCILDFFSLFQPIMAAKNTKNGLFYHFVYKYKQKCSKMHIFSTFCL